jgi:hypothetical protein
MSILISFLYLLLYIAVIILVAFAIKWVIEVFMNVTISGDVLKWAKAVVGLLCLIVVAVWLAGVLGAGPGLPHAWIYR